MISRKLNAEREQKLFVTVLLLPVLLACMMISGHAEETSVTTTESENQSSESTNLSPEVDSADLSFQRDEETVSIFDRGKLVTRYHAHSGRKPILWPLVTPAGVKVTRQYPMDDSDPHETKDHLHHRSVWLTHGEVNETNFWTEEGEKLGAIDFHDVEFCGTVNGVVKLRVSHDWKSHEGELLLTEFCAIDVRHYENCYAIIYDSQLAAIDTEVEFGDTKEGTFGVRVSESLRVDSKLGGRILDSEGRRDAECWGQRARWVDYSGPATMDSPTTPSPIASAGEEVRDPLEAGITIFCHPKNARFPGRWHVRTYGLFAHNPFGQKDFVEVDPEASKTVGGLKLAPRGSIRLRYAILLHDRDWNIKLAERFWKEFSQ